MRLISYLLLSFMLISLSFLAPASSAQEPILEVNNGTQVKQWTRSALLAEAVEIRIVKDSAYKRSMTYRAVPYTKLMPQVEQYPSIQFVASDGFVANIAGSDLAGKGQAYLAIETSEQSWPSLNPDHPQKTASAGPFYLVWLTPEVGKIGSEQWPYQVAKINVAQPLQVRHPQIVPVNKPQIGYAQALKGMQVYVKNCAVCHTMNGGGDASIGPDLNVPFNPTDYFKEPYLRKL
ncbi:c-type cytochrome, partial [Undibacterium sp.]|uniref:c-type cytochrome n=1 Tax=Undibacterium sp. TaxID=1914977 RepID=UPI003752A455